MHANKLNFSFSFIQEDNKQLVTYHGVEGSSELKSDYWLYLCFLQHYRGSWISGDRGRTCGAGGGYTLPGHTLQGPLGMGISANRLTLQALCMFCSKAECVLTQCFRTGLPGVWGSLSDSVVGNTPANAGAARVMGSILGSGRPVGGGHGNPLRYFCLKNPVDRGA